MSTTVTLCDGSQVDSASEAWRQECLAVHTHVVNLRGMGLAQRRAYLDRLRGGAGCSAKAELARRVAAAYAKDFQARKAATEQPT